MKILFLTLVYEKEGNSIYRDLVNELKKDGHKIYVITPCERKNKKETHIQMEEEVNILRFKYLNIQKTNLLEKGISTLLMEDFFIKNIKKYFSNEKFDLVIYSTPPIMFSKVVKFLKASSECKSYLLLKDIFPQNAVDLGMLNINGIKKYIYKYFRKKEEKLYDLSDFIGCMSLANVNYVLANNNIGKDKIIEICPNSIVPSSINNFDKSELRKKHNIDDNKKVFIYGGNLGKPQGIDFLIEVLKTNKNDKEKIFLIVGDGTDYFKIEQLLEDNTFNNVQLHKRLPKEEYEELVKCSDVGLIFLDKRFTIPNFPSRLLGYMDNSLPIIAATDINTDIGKVITENNFGFWCESSEVNKFNDILQECCSGKSNLEEMGNNARKYLEDNYTAKHSADIILKHFK